MDKRQVHKFGKVMNKPVKLIKENLFSICSTVISGIVLQKILNPSKKDNN